jgi:hypothetical protein
MNSTLVPEPTPWSDIGDSIGDACDGAIVAGGMFRTMRHLSAIPTSRCPRYNRHLVDESRKALTLIGRRSTAPLTQLFSNRAWRDGRRSSWPVTVVALAIGVGAAASYYVQDLTLSHYDAKAHLVVARRILDSMQPGWIQIGAVWLPLPHLLNVIPVQLDAFYRNGLSAVAFSVIGFVIGAVALWRLVALATGSLVGAWASLAVFAAHPDVLYLQATPMTESLLMGLCLLGVAEMWKWLAQRGAGRAWPAGLTLALACLTRYEAWPIAAVAIALTAGALLRTGVRPTEVFARVGAFACYPAVAVVTFMVLSRLTVGSWLVTGGFFEVDHSTYHRPLAVLGLVGFGVRTLNGDVMTAIGVCGLMVLLVSIARVRPASHLLIILSLAACVVLPLYAFWNGHPFRIRYLVPFTMALAAVTGAGVGLLPRYRGLAATVVVLTALIETPPLSGRSPMVVEAQRDAANVLARQRLTDCFVQEYDHTPILASMGSLAPYMQETAQVGLALRQFIHEGIGQLWAESLVDAGRHAGWILIEEQAEGGDVLARLRGSSTAFLAGFERRCEGGGVALYQRSKAGAN